MKLNDPDEIQDVLERLSILAPGEADMPKTAENYLKQFKSRVSASPDADAQPRRRTLIMTNRRLATAGLTFVIAIALLMAFPSVRAVAGDLLSLFRVQKFAPISVSSEQMALLQELEEQNLSPGEFVSIKEPDDPVRVSSLDDAAAQTGYQVRTIIGRDLSSELQVRDEASGSFIIDLAGSRALLQAAGVDPMVLPDSLDGGRVDVHVYPFVRQTFSDDVVIMQTAAPDVSYPEGVDLNVIGEAALRLLGSDPETAQRMAQSIDWTSTLLLPIPQELGTYSEVAIDGVTGVAFEPFSLEADPGIVWQKNGMVYMVSGPVPTQDLIDLANSLN